MADPPPDGTSRTDIADAPGRSRFEIRVDGDLVGFADYRRRPGRLALTHTEVDDAHQGRGLAARLTRFALDAVREQGLQVNPICPYVADYIRRHPEYADLVHEVGAPQSGRAAPDES